MTNDSINMLDKTGNERIQIINNSESSAINFTGNVVDFPVVSLFADEEREYGVFTLRHNPSTSIIFGGFEGFGGNLQPVFAIDGDSTLLQLSSSSYEGDIQLFSRGDKSGIDINKDKIKISVDENMSSIKFNGNSNEFPLIGLTADEEGGYGEIILRHSPSLATIFGGFEGSGDNLQPIFAINGDSALLQLTSDLYDGEIQMYTRGDQSGLEVRRLTNTNIAELRSDNEGKFGILQLHNATNTGGVSILGGEAGEVRTTIIIEEDTSSIQMFAPNTEGRLKLEVKGDDSSLGMTNGSIVLATPESANYIELSKDEIGGMLTLSNLDDTALAQLSTGTENGYGALQLLGANGSQNILATEPIGADNHGFLSILNDMGAPKVLMYSTLEGHGELDLRGANGNNNIFMSKSSDPNRPYFHLANTAGIGRAGMLIDANDKGYIFSEKYVLLNAGNAEVAEIFINDEGNSEINAHTISGMVKNFKIDHPKEKGKEIWFACIEGPEVAAYARGTATLSNGEALVNLPSYFSDIVEAEGITLTITPLSADSKGIAVIAKSVHEISVKELFQGEGNYQFDWEIKAVRSGFADYKVVRDKARKPKSNKHPIPNVKSAVVGKRN